MREKREHGRILRRKSRANTPKVKEKNTTRKYRVRKKELVCVIKK